jgi:hypothetical protein
MQLDMTHYMRMVQGVMGTCTMHTGPWSNASQRGCNNITREVQGAICWTRASVVRHADASTAVR